jgi:hypothetical protein
LTTASTHSQDDSDSEEMDIDNIYGREYDNTNEDFSYHSSDGSDKDDAGYDRSLGNGMEGMSPPATAYSKDGQFPLGGQVEDLPDWLHEMDTNQIMMHHTFLLPPSPRFFRVLPAITTATSMTPLRGFPFSCESRVRPLGRFSTKIVVKWVLN